MHKIETMLGAVILAASILGGCTASGSVSSADTSILGDITTAPSTEFGKTTISLPELQADQLVNQMSEHERTSVKVGPLTILDKPWNDFTPDPYWDGVVLEIGDSEDVIKYDRIMLNSVFLTEDLKAYLEEEIQSAQDYPSSRRIFEAYINGKPVPFCPDYPEYDGGGFDIYQSFGLSSGETVDINESFENYEEFKAWLPGFLEEAVANDYFDSTWFDLRYEDIINVWDAVISGDYIEAPIHFMENHNIWYSLGSTGDKDWEYVPDEVEAIKDSVQEIHITDDELGMNFLVHVILPPNYDSDQTYPVLFLTDAVWRFGSAPALWQTMADGKAQPMIIVTLGYDYNLNGADGNLRGQLFTMMCNRADDFITDNLMPLISEMYKIDCDTSVFYGHSDGGVLSFYCLFNSDLYENQPFGRYIIGSPALWGLYEGMGRDVFDNYCGYWERNSTINKSVYITAGELEDPDYASGYNGYPSTIEGAQAVYESIIEHGGDCEFKLYEGSHHYQYIPDMLLEYISY